jgi:hypothetical protein
LLAAGAFAAALGAIARDDWCRTLASDSLRQDDHAEKDVEYIYHDSYRGYFAVIMTVTEDILQ